MSITNFTRGPWHWRVAARFVDARHNEIQIADLEGSRPGLIVPPSFETQANGYLIASAPDLYAALDAFLDAYEETGEVDFAIRQKARAALNRAEGRTP